MTWRKKPQQVNLDNIKKAVDAAVAALAERVRREVAEREASEAQEPSHAEDPCNG